MLILMHIFSHLRRPIPEVVAAVLRDIASASSAYNLSRTYKNHSCFQWRCCRFSQFDPGPHYPLWYLMSRPDCIAGTTESTVHNGLKPSHLVPTLQTHLTPAGAIANMETTFTRLCVSAGVA